MGFMKSKAGICAVLLCLLLLAGAAWYCLGRNETGRIPEATFVRAADLSITAVPVHEKGEAA